MFCKPTALKYPRSHYVGPTSCPATVPSNGERASKDNFDRAAVGHLLLSTASGTIGADTSKWYCHTARVLVLLGGGVDLDNDVDLLVLVSRRPPIRSRCMHRQHSKHLRIERAKKRSNIIRP
jgi:hypothetical protein